jgi:hypothetical protein
MRGLTRSMGVALGALAAASLLAACSSSPAKPASSTSTTTTSTSSTTSTTVPVSTTTSTANTTCQPSQLNITLSGSEGAAGTIELTFSLTNTSASLCTMFGYPGMQLLSASGASEPTSVIRGGGLAFENVTPASVSLANGQAAYFNVGYSDVVTGTTACTVSKQVEITPPNDTAHAVVPVSNQIQACNAGELHVSAVFASSNASATVTTAPAG